MFNIFKCLKISLICIVLLPPYAVASVYYTEGHSDIRFGDGDQLDLHQHCDGNPQLSGAYIDGLPLASPVEYSPAGIITVVPDTTKNYVNTIGGATVDVAEKLGLNAGDNYWFLPQSSFGSGSAPYLHAPYLGLGTETMSYGVFDGDVMDFTLMAMSAPTGGWFALQQSGTWLMSATNGSGGGAVTNYHVNTHNHYKWFFSKPGVYHLTFQVSATRDEVPETDTDTYTFLVGGCIWKGTNGNNWNDVGNWVSGITPPSTNISGVPSAGSTVIFTSSADPNQPLTQDIAAPLDLHGVIFTANAGAYQLGGQTIRLSVDSPEITSESPNNQQIGNPLDLAENTTFAVNGSGNITLEGAISGNGSLTKSGSDELILANNANHTGDTLIEAGALALDAAGQIENSAIVNNATFQILAGSHTVGTISGTGETEVLMGSLTVDSIVQGKLKIDAGAKLILRPATGSPLSDQLTPVPEPATTMLLVLMLACLIPYQLSKQT
jgi:surface-anchored protein